MMARVEEALEKIHRSSNRCMSRCIFIRRNRFRFRCRGEFRCKCRCK